jgi:CBS domain-containing protein
MRAIDVMVHNVVTVRPDTDVAEATKLLAEHDVSALPVLDQDGSLIGMLSEADLIHRAEIGTEKHRPWWLEAVTGATTLAEEFAKSHGKKVGEVMTTGVISVTEETPLFDIATLFERKRIKRVPVVKDGKLVGIVSRANLIQAPRWPAGSTRTTKRTAKFGFSCCHDSKTKNGPVLASETSRSATVSCIFGGSSVRKKSTRRCSRSRKASAEYRVFPMK